MADVGKESLADDEKSLQAVEPRFARARLFFRSALHFSLGIVACERWARAALAAYNLKLLDDLHTLAHALLDSEDEKKDIDARFSEVMRKYVARAGVTFTQGLAPATIFALIEMQHGIIWPHHFRVVCHDKAVPCGWRLATSRDVKVNEKRLKRDNILLTDTIALLEDDNYGVRGSAHDPAGPKSPKAVKRDGQCEVGHKLLVKATLCR